MIDTTNVPFTSAINGIHWPTAQATSLQNMRFELSSAPGTQHVGFFMESGKFVLHVLFFLLVNLSMRNVRCEQSADVIPRGKPRRHNLTPPPPPFVIIFKLTSLNRVWRVHDRSYV